MREQARLDSMEPPSFYEVDHKKWHEAKFRVAQEDRQQAKIRIKALGCFVPLGTKNTNTVKAGVYNGSSEHQHLRQDLKRRNSRGSGAMFVAPDFEYSGNTNAV